MSGFQIYQTIEYPPPVDYVNYGDVGFRVFIYPYTAVINQGEAPSTMLWGLNFEEYNTISYQPPNNDFPWYHSTFRDNVISTDLETFADDDQKIEDGETLTEILGSASEIVCLKNLKAGNRYNLLSAYAQSSDITFNYDTAISSFSASGVVQLSYNVLVDRARYTVKAIQIDPLPACTYTENFLEADANGVLLNPQTGFDMEDNQLIIINGQADAKQNGIYTVDHAGTADTPFVLIRENPVAGSLTNASWIPNDMYVVVEDMDYDPYYVQSTGTVDVNNISFVSAPVEDFDVIASQTTPFSIRETGFSMSIWIKKNSVVGTSNDYTIFGVIPVGFSSNTYFISFPQNGNATFYFTVDNETELDVQLMMTWQNIVFTVASQTVNVYVNTVLTNTFTIVNASPATLAVCPLLTNSRDTDEVVHSVANLSAWNSVLTQNEIDYLYANPRLVETA